MRTRIFRVDPASKAVDELTPTSFSASGFQETQDIHEWLASHPGLLGENLLVIQREHIGVQHSLRRPDLLAMDTDGSLVVVEAKRDESGTDVYWQAALYAASYWARSATDIVEMYASYASIDRGEAVQQLVTHTGSEDEEDLLQKLNTKQKLVLVARTFPKEVTTTVLWLNEQGLDVSCLELTPHFDQKTNTHYIQSSYIIPGTETKDLMVELRRTQQERKAQEADVANRQDDEVTRFMHQVRGELDERLPQGLKPDKWSRWAGQWGSIRYYRFWYEQPPWQNGNFCFAAELETDVGKTRSGEVHVRFFVYVTYLRSAGYSEDMISRLREIAGDFGRETGRETRQLEATFFVGKWIPADGLSQNGAAGVAAALAELIQVFKPRLREFLDSVESETFVTAVPITVRSDGEGTLDA